MNINEKLYDYMRPLFGIATVLLPLSSFFHARTTVRSLVDYVVFVLFVGSFYLSSSLLLRRLTELAGTEADSGGPFHNIRVSVAQLTTVSLMMTMLAWAFADFAAHHG